MYFVQVTVVISVLAVFVECKKIPKFSISGTLFCRGNPIRGKIIMLDDNFSLFDHLLNERTVDNDGKFRLVGNPEDDDLDVLLVIEHSCHHMRKGRTSEKIDAFSVYQISYSDIEDSKMNLEKDFELSEGNGSLSASFPFLYAWKTAFYSKRIISENAARVKDLGLWK